MFGLSFFTTLALATCVACGSIVLWSNPRYAANQRFALLCGLSALWCLGLTFFFIAPDEGSAAGWFRLASVGWTLGVSAWLDFAVVISRPRLGRPPRWVTAIIWAPGLFLLYVVVVERLSYTDFQMTRMGWSYIRGESLWADLTDGVQAGGGLAVVALLGRWTRRAIHPLEKRQARLILGASLLFTVVMTAEAGALYVENRSGANGILTAIIPVIDPLNLLVCLGIFAYSLQRHKTMILTSRIAAPHLLETMADGVVMLDPDGTILVANRASETLLAQPGNTLVGRPMEEIVRPSELPAGGFLAQMTKGGSVRDVELRPILTGPSTTRLSANLSVVSDRYDNVLGTVLVLRDVTDLREYQKKMVALSRRAGQAEVAVGVIHNIGNVITSLNVALDTSLESLSRSSVPRLARVAHLLADHEKSDVSPEQKGLAREFLMTLAAALEQEEEEHTASLRAMKKHVGLICQVIVAQQSFAGGEAPVERHSVSELVEDALELNQIRFRDQQVEVQRDYRLEALVAVVRYDAVLVLDNLLRNAGEAISRSTHHPKRVTVRIEESEEGGVVVEVADNGEGIDPENIGKIFEFGFTTKPDRGGFGLHNAALTAKNMGGHLEGDSPGPGSGAVFRLWLPKVDPPDGLA